MTFTYWLPDEQGQKQEYTTSNNSVIIIGANGSGKSHLGAWIEQQDLENVHRIGAQRNLNFNEDIALKSYSQAENFVFYGTDNKGYVERKDKAYRWEWGKYTTKLVNCKDISTSIGHFFEIDNKAYCSLVIALLHGDKHDDIVNALVPYLPTDIPR